MMKTIAWCLLLGLALTGCAKAPFTTAVIKRFQLTTADLGRVQFFTSEPIVLRRESTSRSRVASGAALGLHDDMQVEEIVVSEQTPCVVLRAEGDYLLLGFSPKDTRAALWFRAPEMDENTDNQPSGGGRLYEFVALDNTLEEPGPFTPRWSKGFLVSWSGKKYYVLSGRGAYLLYERDDDFERHRVEYDAPGWRVSERRVAPTSQGSPAAATPDGQ